MEPRALCMLVLPLPLNYIHAQTKGGWYTCFLSSYIVPTIKTRVQEELASPFCLAMLTQSINVLAICLDPVTHGLKRAIEKRVCFSLHCGGRGTIARGCGDVMAAVTSSAWSYVILSWKTERNENLAYFVQYSSPWNEPVYCRPVFPPQATQPRTYRHV